MTKILNIDALVKEERVIKLEGVTYQIKDISVADFIKINQMAEEADKKEEPTVAERVMFLAETVFISVPDCPKEVLMKCSLAELNMIASFARDGTLPEDESVEVLDESGKK
jgi:hypothetical protein